MPRRQDVKKVLILGSGPIVIGQACEFDYSGTQACKALKAEGVEVILVNSNPATIMTDPEIASKVYVEPLTTAYLEKIIERERPDSLIPTLGGQTALNAALALADEGILKKYNVSLLGTSPEIIRKAEDRGLFKDLVEAVGGTVPRSYMVRTYEEGMKVVEELGVPIVLRPNFTLGGGGGGIAYSLEEYKRMIQAALSESPTSECLVEQSILGWKEFELEVMRDSRGTFVVICSIENMDPCGVHTGDSITVAPQQTLSDREYQSMRDEARKIVDAVGIETGGANIQFATHPVTGARVVIEMNPRVSRSSALASKATGFPIAKIAALLAIGYTLDEIQNDITGSTPCCYEPALDYVVTKIPRFAFEKFTGAKDVLTTQMKSVGEVMGIGRTFKESLMKSLQSLENKGLNFQPVNFSEDKLAYPNSHRIHFLAEGFRRGMTVSQIEGLTQIDPWFLEQLETIVKMESEIKAPAQLDRKILLRAKRMGFSDATIASLRNIKAQTIRQMRWSMSIFPGYLQVDTCAGEFQSSTPYFYSSYWATSEKPSATMNSDRVVILGSGPNRIGQGIEFDYGCVRGVLAFQKAGLRVVMINSNPETVSTDYDTANELYFEPMTEECVIEVMRHLNPRGFVPQWGGQTSLNLSHSLVQAGFRLLGSSLDAIDLAEDRARFGELCRELNFIIPRAGMAHSLTEAEKIAADIQFPIMCRPSYVLGGRRMEVLYSMDELRDYFERYGEFVTEKSPILLDEFLAGALEVDVDLVRGRGWTIVGGVLEHIEAAGVHSGDSMGVIPPQRLRDSTCDKIEALACRMAELLDVIGHLNLQLAVKNDEIYMIEANPRSSRSVPFIAKATGIPLVDLSVQAMLGEKPTREYRWRNLQQVSVKGVVFPFKKFPEADSILGPEMKSTGESMGRGRDYAEALKKAFISSFIRLPESGEVFLSLRDKDKEELLPVARDLEKMGFHLIATSGTAEYLNTHRVPCETIKKVREGRPNCVDRIRSGEVKLVINTTSGRRAIEDSFSIRRSCIDYFVPCLTESDAALAFLLAMKQDRLRDLSVEPLPRTERESLQTL